jgi:hypothetical protein
VAFVGGAHWGVGVSVGGGVGVGWFPLGWNEPYVPAYAVSRNYFTNVNVTNIHVTNVTVINNYYQNTTVVNNMHYANRTVPGAFTAVPASAMASSQSVSRVALHVPPAEIAKAQIGGAAPVAPSRNAVLGVNAGAHAAVPPAQTLSRQVVTKNAPPPRPVPFEAKQEALAKNPGHPLDAQSEQQIRARLPSPQNNANLGSSGVGAARNANHPGGAAAPYTNSSAAPPKIGGAPGPASGHSVPRPPSAGGGVNPPRSNANVSPANVPGSANGRAGTVDNSGSNNSGSSARVNKDSNVDHGAEGSSHEPVPHSEAPKPPPKKAEPAKKNEEHKDKDKDKDR